MTGVNPETYYAAAKQLTDIGSGIDTAISALLKALDGTGSMSGTSEAARKWATSYDTRAQQAVDTAHKVAQTLPYFGYLVALAGYNHELSDYNADIDKQSRKPPDKPVTVQKPAALCWVHPPSAGGPGNGLVSFAALMEKVHIHVPDGDADKLGKAANAWKTFNQTDAVADAHSEVVKVTSTLNDLQSGEIPDLIDCLTTLQNSAWNLAGTTNQLAGDCLSHKMALDNLRHRIDKVVTELDEVLAAQLVVTIAAAFLSVGTGAVAAGGADAAISAAEVSGAAEKITEVVEAVDVDGILVEAASEEDTLASAGKDLDEIADLEPETIEEEVAESSETETASTDAHISKSKLESLSADDILADDGSALGPSTGKKMPVRTVRDKGDLDEIWSKLTNDAPQPGPGEKFTSYTRPDGTRIQYRITSTSGGETIDINATTTGGKTWKVHLPKAGN